MHRAFERFRAAETAHESAQASLSLRTEEFKVLNLLKSSEPKAQVVAETVEACAELRQSLELAVPV